MRVWFDTKLCSEYADIRMIMTISPILEIFYPRPWSSEERFKVKAKMLTCIERKKSLMFLGMGCVELRTTILRNKNYWIEFALDRKWGTEGVGGEAALKITLFWWHIKIWVWFVKMWSQWWCLGYVWQEATILGRCGNCASVPSLTSTSPLQCLFYKHR